VRSLEQIQDIKSRESGPVQLLNILSNQEVQDLIKYYNTTEEKITKNTGPVMLTINEGQGIIDNILQKLRKSFGDFEVRSAHYFDVKDPHIIHIDDGKDLPNSYKAFTIPLYVEGNDDSKAKLIMFDQHYYGGAAKFMKNGPANKVQYYNKHLYLYDDVDGINNDGIPVELKDMFGHLREQWLEGLSVRAYFPWNIGSIIAFDSLQLHCASNFKKQDITRKLGISIFTKWPEE
jgi:hypothetical protein